jgi:uncharacterized protein YndB with AHSA1/START domain
VKVAQSLLIGRTPDDVFRHITDIERYPEWQVAAGIRQVERADVEPLGQGSRFHVERVTQGMAGTIDCVVTAFEPGGRFSFEGRDSAGFDVLVDTVLEPDGPATRVDWSMEIANHRINRFLQPIVTGQMRRAAAIDLENFKRRLEAVADGS